MIPQTLTTSLRGALPSIALLLATASFVPRACGIPAVTAEAIESPVPTIAPEIVACGGHPDPAACIATVSQPEAIVRTILAEALVGISNLGAALDASERARAAAETKSGRLGVLLENAEAQNTGLLDENIVLRGDTVALWEYATEVEAEAAEMKGIAVQAIDAVREEQRQDVIDLEKAETTEQRCSGEKRTKNFLRCEDDVAAALSRAAAHDEDDPMADLLDRARSLGAIEDGKRTVTYTAGSVSD